MHRTHPNIQAHFAYTAEEAYSNVPNKRTGKNTVFWEKTLIDVLWLFLTSENYLDWLTWLLALCMKQNQDSSQSMEIIFTGQK